MARALAVAVELPPEAEALEFCDNCNRTLARCHECGSFADETHADDCQVGEGWMRCEVYWHPTRRHQSYYEEPEGHSTCERCSSGEREGD